MNKVLGKATVDSSLGSRVRGIMSLTSYRAAPPCSKNIKASRLMKVHARVNSEKMEEAVMHPIFY